MYEELCQSDTEKRLKMISLLTLWELDEICFRVKRCNRCPLAIHFIDKHGVSRYSCMLVSSSSSIERALAHGGHFLKMKGV